MSAIRLRETSKGLEVRVNDETPISDAPVTLAVRPGHTATPTYLSLSVSEVLELANALSTAALEALRHTIAEPCDGRVPHDWSHDKRNECPRRAPK